MTKTCRRRRCASVQLGCNRTTLAVRVRLGRRWQPTTILTRTWIRTGTGTRTRPLTSCRPHRWDVRTFGAIGAELFEFWVHDHLRIVDRWRKFEVRVQRYGQQLTFALLKTVGEKKLFLIDGPQADDRFGIAGQFGHLRWTVAVYQAHRERQSFASQTGGRVHASDTFCLGQGAKPSLVVGFEEQTAASFVEAAQEPDALQPELTDHGQHFPGQHSSAPSQGFQFAVRVRQVGFAPLSDQTLVDSCVRRQLANSLETRRPMAIFGQYLKIAAVVERYGHAGGGQSRTLAVLDFDQRAKQLARPLLGVRIGDVRQADAQVLAFGDQSDVRQRVAVDEFVQKRRVFDVPLDCGQQWRLSGHSHRPGLRMRHKRINESPKTQNAQPIN
ncbi:hypothetical protein T4D_11229 [Trichinella pseudospiralis]|uniref:Uncharacterized protein n=1 Tax=Trichinella pseudospiralis TaxID=6337 RepID=A0A0V1F634_TRIPS|nr:hypothetical protein T4D_11229 [Trichinella pseudospiralis]